MTLTGPTIELMNVAEDMPVAVGGTIVDGTYDVTGRRLYTGPGGASGGTGDFQSITGIVLGETAELVIELGVGNRLHASYTLLSSDTFAIVTLTCPDNIGIEWDTFTATSDQIILFSTADNSLIEFTRVP